MNTEKMTIRLSPELKKFLKEKAKKEGRSLNNYLGWVLMKEI